MSIKTKRLLLVLPIVIVVGALTVLLLKDSEKEQTDKSVEQPLESKVKNVKRMNDLAKRLDKFRKIKGGLPASLALKQAKSEEQRAFLTDELARQNQTKDQAADQARKKLKELEDKLRALDNPDEKQVLERQILALKRITANLEHIE